MKAGEVRDWLGKYFLLMTVSLGGYILLFAGRYTVLLRIDWQTGMDCFQIIIPTLLGQLTIIFRFYGAANAIDEKASVPIPDWVVKWPPLLLAGLVVVTIVLMAFGNVEGGQQVSPLQDQFKMIVTFYVAVLNATTVFVVSRLFESQPEPVKQEEKKEP